MLSWDDHHLVLTLARAGTVAGAARALGVNETTVARRLAAIEADAGTTLFRRVDRKLEPSAGGRTVVAAAEAMERALAGATEGAENLSGVVRISSVNSVIDHLVAPFLADFAVRYPGLVLELVAANEVVSLARREADIAIRLDNPGGGKLLVRRIATLRYRLAANIERDPSEALRGGYLAYDRERDDTPEILELRGRFGGTPLARIDSLSGIRAAAEAGLGMAMLPDWMITRSERLRIIDPDVTAERSLWLVVHADLKNRPSVRAAADWLANTISASAAR